MIFLIYCSPFWVVSSWAVGSIPYSTFPTSTLFYICVGSLWLGVATHTFEQGTGCIQVKHLVLCEHERWKFCYHQNFLLHPYSHCPEHQHSMENSSGNTSLDYFYAGVQFCVGEAEILACCSPHNVLCILCLTLILLMWRIGWAHNNARK